MGMMRIAALSIRRNLKSPRFWLLAFISVLVLLSERMGDFTNKLLLGKAINQSYSFVFMLGVGLSYTVFPFVFTPVCTLAGSLGFYEDTAHDFSRPICARISKSDYIRGHIISSAMTGGLAGVAMIVISAVLLRMVYPAHAALMQTAEFGSIPDNAVLILNGWGLVAKIAAAYFLGGMALSLVGLACSAIVPNRYVAIFAPLLLFTSIHFILSYLHVAYTPLNLLMTYGFEVPLYICAILFGVASLMAGCVFSTFSKKRLAGE